MRRLIAVPFVIAAAFALTACGTKTIDAGSLEDDIQTQLADAAKVKPDTVKVSCPEDKEAKKGNTFDCTDHDERRLEGHDDRQAHQR